MATKTPYDVIVNYDIEKKGTDVHDKIKEAMIAKGYSDRFTNLTTKTVINLPNTTLWKEKISVQEAYDDIGSCLAKYNEKIKVEKDRPTLERCLAVEFTEYWYATSGITHVGAVKAPNKAHA